MVLGLTATVSLYRTSTAVLLTAFLGVVITLVETRLWIPYSVLLKLYFDRLLKKGRKLLHPHKYVPVLLVNPQPVGGVPPGNPSNLERVQQIEDLLHLSEHSHSDIGLSLRLFKDVLRNWRALPSHREEVLLKLWLAILLLVLFIAITLGVIFSAFIVLDSDALCQSSKCGLWYQVDADLAGPRSLAADSSQVETPQRKQTGAALRVARCYRGSHSVEGCDNLFSKSIRYNTSLSICPVDGDVCEQEDLAFSLDTGWQDAKILGSDSPQKQSFRHQTTCALVLVNMTHIAQQMFPSGKVTVRYYCGAYWAHNHTFETPVSDWVNGPGIGTYMVDLVTNSDTDDFQFIPPFRSRLGL